MMATLAILTVAVALAVVAGAAMRGLTDPDGRWLSVETIPLGVGTLIALLYSIVYVVPLPVATFVIVGLCVLGLAVAALLRARRSSRADGDDRPRWLAAITPERPDLVVVASGVLLTVLLLIPTLKLGFPTTIARSNNDGWSYASFVNWFSNHRLSDPLRADILHPLDNTPYFQLIDGFGCGFEMYASMVKTLMLRQPYEVVGIANATGALVATCGWGALFRRLTGALTVRTALIAPVAAMAPTAALAYTENFAPQFFSLSLMPFAFASVLAYLDRPRPGRLVVAAVAVMAVIGVYPAVVPWLLMGITTLALVTLVRLRRAPDDSAPPLPWVMHALRRVIGPLIVLGATAVVVGWYPARQAWTFITVHDDNSGFSAYPRFTNRGYASLASGTSTYFHEVVGSPVPWAAKFLTIVLIIALAAVVVVAVVRGRGPSRALVVMMAGAFIATGVVWGRFASLENQAYGMFKSVVSGGTVFCGLAMLLLACLAQERQRQWALAFIAAWAAVWFTIGADNVEQSFGGGSGFRANEVQMGRELAKLPDGSTVLAGGAADEPGAFQLRMMAGYFGTVDGVDLNMRGLGTTTSYIAPGGTPGGSPEIPWRYILETRAPTPVTTPRRLLWENGGYRLQESPVVDVTRYGLAWLPSEQDTTGGFAWVSGPVTLVVSNRGTAPRRARLRMTLQSLGAPLPVRLSSMGHVLASLSPPADRPEPVAVTVDVPPNAVRVIRMIVPAVNPASPGDPRKVRVQGIAVTPLPGAASSG